MNSGTHFAGIRSSHALDEPFEHQKLISRTEFFFQFFFGSSIIRSSRFEFNPGPWDNRSSSKYHNHHNPYNSRTKNCWNMFCWNTIIAYMRWTIRAQKNAKKRKMVEERMIEIRAFRTWPYLAPCKADALPLSHTPSRDWIGCYLII